MRDAKSLMASCGGKALMSSCDDMSLIASNDAVKADDLIDSILSPIPLEI